MPLIPCPECKQKVSDKAEKCSNCGLPFPAKHVKVKPWYKTWWGIILAILFWPISILWYTWKKSNWRKNVKIGITAAIIIILLVTIAAGDTDTGTPTTPSSEQNSRGEQPTSEETANPVAEETVKPKTMLDKLWEALDAGIKTRTCYDINYEKSLKDAVLTCYKDTFWDENTLVRNSYSDLAKFGKEAFKLDGVAQITIVYATNFTNSYGNNSRNNAVIITMTEKNFNKFNWQGLSESGISVAQQIEDASEVYFIHSAIRKNLNEGKLYFSFN